MTDTIAELRELLAQATGGPWRCFDSIHGNSTIAIMKGDRPKVGRWKQIITWAGFDGTDVGKRYDRSNQKLIVAMRNSIEALLDRVEEGERAIDFLDMRRPIKGIEYRSAEEVFAIMADRIMLAEAGHYRLPPAQQKADTP